MPYEVIGEFFEAGSGRSVPASFSVDPDGDVFILIADGIEYSGYVSDLKVEPPLGRQPRKLYLPDGHLFQTDERDAVADMLPYGIYRLVMPFMVNMALGLTPTAAIHQMDRSTIATLDRFITDESDLPEETQVRLTEVFEELVEAGTGERTARPPKYKLLFRGGKMGPNAFALPGGTIVITDDLVEMFPDNEDALAGVLGHEIGHVEMEHSLRRLYRAVGVATMVTLMAGDAGPLVEEVLLEGGALLSLSFSRHQETDSDNFSVDLLHEIGRDPEAMAAFFEEIEKLTSFGGDKDEHDHEDHENDVEISNEDDDKDPVDIIDSVDTPISKDEAAPKINTEWISTHPLSQKRIENIRKRAAQLREE